LFFANDGLDIFLRFLNGFLVVSLFYSRSVNLVTGDGLNVSYDLRLFRRVDVFQVVELGDSGSLRHLLEVILVALGPI
jgi:hypothetical protein